MSNAESKTIADVQADWENLVLPVTPPGMAARVSIRNVKDNRKVRWDADASRFNPASCEVVISFERVERQGDSSSLPAPAAHSAANGPLADLLRALDAAERDQRFREFIGIKTFRDRYLVARGFAWASDPASRHAVLSKATNEGIVLRSSVPNPRDPSFPTTSIRVNREHPEAKRILAESAAERSPFRPIVLPGAELSASILAERR